MFPSTDTTVLVEVPIEAKILASSLDEGEKRKFLNLLSYFTPSELRELETMLA